MYFLCILTYLKTTKRIFGLFYLKKLKYYQALLKTENCMSFKENIIYNRIDSFYYMIVVVQSPNLIQLFAIPWTAALLASLSLTISQSLPNFMSVASVMLSSHLILWHPLLLPSIFPSIRVFSNESSVLIRWPKYWNFNFSICPSNEYSGLVSFKIDCFGLSHCPRDSQKSSPAPQFKGINSLVLCLLYSPALTTIHIHWEDKSLDYTDLCRQGDVSAFQHTI